MRDRGGGVKKNTYTKIRHLYTYVVHIVKKCFITQVLISFKIETTSLPQTIGSQSELPCSSHYEEKNFSPGKKEKHLIIFKT